MWPAPRTRGSRLRRLLRPVALALLAGLVLDGLDAVAGVAFPALVRGGVDHGVVAGQFHPILLVSLAGLAIVLADWAISAVQTVVVGRNGERLLYTLRVKIFAHLQRLGLDFYERELSGRIMTRMTTDVDALSSFLQTGLITMVNSLLTFVGVMIALLFIDARLGLTLFAIIPVLVVVTVVFRIRSSRAYTEARERVSVVNADLQENVAGLRIAQAYRRAPRNAARFAGLSTGYRQSRLRAQRYIALYFPFVQLLSTVAAALVLFTAASQVHSGTLTAGGLVAFLLYIDLLFAPVQQLSQVFDGYQQASVGLRRIKDLLRTPTSTPQAERPRRPGRLRGQIEFRDVHFRVPGPAGRRAERGQPDGRARRDRGAGRPDRRRQVHHGQAGRPVLRRDRRAGPDRRDRPARARPGRVPARARRRAAGAVPVPRHGPGRDRLRPARRDRRRGGGGRPGGRRAST